MHSLSRLLSLSTFTLALAAAPALAQSADEVRQKLQGSWVATKAERDGKSADDVIGHRLTFKGELFKINAKDGKDAYAGAFHLRPAMKPPAIDFNHTLGALKAKQWKGIYKLDGDTLTICDNAENLKKPRPTAFEAKAGSGDILITFERAKP
jgi:uncharacterized protein (TIGR03067 family)